MYRYHRKGPGGPPGGATYPGGPHGLKWDGEPAPGGLVRLPLPPPLRLGLETLGVGGKPPPWPPPPLRSHLQGAAPPLGPI